MQPKQSLGRTLLCLPGKILSWLIVPLVLSIILAVGPAVAPTRPKPVRTGRPPNRWPSCSRNLMPFAATW